ncbi:MAG: LacI family DNA-binding transcriptional regulator [Sphingomonadales bacterium]|jgi:LacI family repressor for deo operon, udp, cdd, tsx, nupC, and nupG
MSKSRRSVTIHDVARVAGVSIATVSRAFNNPDLLSPDARQAIERAVETLNYRPHVAARRLRGSRTNLVLVVVPSLNPYFLEIFAGAEDAAKAAGYGVLVGHSERELARERGFIEQVAAGRADGLILVTTVDSYEPDECRGMPPTVIALDIGEHTELPQVRIDHVGASDMITSYLLDLGHRRIAHIMGAPGSSLTSHRLDGFRQALARRGIGFDPALCLPGDFTVDGGIAAASAIVAMAEPPTAVFAANDQTAIGALQQFRSLGWRVPGDISVVGFDDDRMAAIASPALSTVHVPTYQIGYHAMEKLLLLLGSQPIERDTVLEAEVVVRRSAAAPPRPPAPAAG